jgi:hypothetical protein
MIVFTIENEAGEIMDCTLWLDLTIISEDFEDLYEDEYDEYSEDEETEETVSNVEDGDEFYLLEDWPEEPDVITCSGTSSSKNWIYYFPDKVDRHSDVRFWNA